MKFAFGYESSEKHIGQLVTEAQLLWSDISITEVLPFYLIAARDEAATSVLETEDYVGAVSGWIRNTDLPSVNLNDPTTFQAHHRALFDAITQGTWPLQGGFTGAFSGVVFEKRARSLTILNDAIGMYPIFISEQGSGVLGATNILIVSRTLNSIPDIPGVLQTITGPNYGRRTVSSGVLRLLPGELRRYADGKYSGSLFDNTLYSERAIAEARVEDLAPTVWGMTVEDVKACIGDAEEVNVCMSGGWDSRLVAAALRGGSCKLRFFTWGTDEENYEVQLAKRCAAVAGAEFNFRPIQEHWFPSLDRFRENVAQTGSVYVPELLSVLDAPNTRCGTVILMGDMYESIVGRKLEGLTRRDERIRLYKEKLRGKRPQLTLASEKSSVEWSSEIEKAIVTRQLDGLRYLRQEIVEEIAQKDIEEILRGDIHALTKRVKEHDIQFSVQYEELFNWYTNVRTTIARQILMLGEKFYSYGPTMSFSSLRTISSIDPVARATGRLLDEIIKLPELAGYARIPSAMIPFVPSSWPRIVKDGVWIGRHLADRYLTKRLLGKRSGTTRTRLIKSDDLVALYRMPEASERIDSWFSERVIMKEEFIRRWRRRALLQSWPLVNYDIIGAANTSILLDLMEGQD